MVWHKAIRSTIFSDENNKINYSSLLLLSENNYQCIPARMDFYDIRALKTEKKNREKESIFVFWKTFCFSEKDNKQRLEHI